MNAKKNDLGRIQEIYDIIQRTSQQIDMLSFTKEQFLDPQTNEDDLIAEGLMNRIFRLTEELGHLDEELARAYKLDTRGARGIRNRLAHTYGDVDREVIWSVIEDEFDEIKGGCEHFCDDEGIELEAESIDEALAQAERNKLSGTSQYHDMEAAFDELLDHSNQKD